MCNHWHEYWCTLGRVWTAQDFSAMVNCWLEGSDQVLCWQVWRMWTNVFCVVHVHIRSMKYDKNSCKTLSHAAPFCHNGCLRTPTLQRHRVFWIWFRLYSSSTELTLLWGNVQHSAMITKKFNVESKPQVEQKRVINFYVYFFVTVPF